MDRSGEAQGCADVSMSVWCVCQCFRVAYGFEFDVKVRGLAVACGCVWRGSKAWLCACVARVGRTALGAGLRLGFGVRV